MGMCLQKGMIVFITAGALSLLSACNQLDIVLPSMGSYQVNALINHSSLDEYSIIAAEDTVQPYFSSSVAGDPDLVSLVVYLEDSAGYAVGGRVRYTTEAVPVREDGEAEGGVPESGAETAAAGGSTEEPGLPARNLTAENDPAGDFLIPVDGFTGHLPSFPIPQKLEIGYYTMVFEIRSRQDLLSRSSRQIYYIGSKKFAGGGIRYYLPGFYGNSHLVPPGVNVLLETQVEYEEGLEPYIIWYNGKRRIGEGFVKDGAAQLLWKAPLQTGFHTIRTELFPLIPQTALKGRIGELSLPVSAGTDENAPPPLKNGDLLYRYQLAGDLQEARTGVELDGTRPAVWYPAKQIYGLTLNAGDRYEAPLGALNPEESSLSGTDEGFFRFFIRFSPLGEGPIFGARLGNTAQSVTLELSVKENALYLEAEGRDEKFLGDPLEITGAEGSFTGVIIDVEVRKTGLGVYLKTADSPYAAPDSESTPENNRAVRIVSSRETEPFRGLELSLDTPLQGELRSWLGKGTNREKPVNSVYALPVSEGGQSDSAGVSGPVAVIDDFIALFCTVTEIVEEKIPQPMTEEDPPAPGETVPADN
jgi:hypothetical protein